ncbi:hypothetical protein DFR70_109255 [Nocardia tenerifensis]|uniref:Uncharacterized protein n=1 Tax=Nocardia tenerifensis TaxID=228006 RepID=A0A318JVB9_9NOCA|nr:hypothetical protein [Nocardia tenerifensis]PXX61064.1 hypothetical protein DFR70_109255 [Nocardia tenerifensis]
MPDNHARRTAAGGYTWQIVGRGPAGAAVAESGEGVLAAPDPHTGRVCANHIEVGTAVFDGVAADLVVEHRNAVLEARIDGRPDPAPPFDELTLIVRDGDGVERLSTTATLTYPAVTVADLDTYRAELATAEKHERRRRERRDRAVAAGTCAPPSSPLDPRVARLVRELRVEAATVREEVPDLDHCRAQLALAQHTLHAALAAAEQRRQSDNSDDIDYAYAFAQRWTPRVRRWAAILELITEAYLDADAVDALADRLSLRAPPAE